MTKFCTHNVNALCEYEAALELPAGDATVKEGFVCGFAHAPADDELIVLNAHAQILGPKAGDRERDFQPVFSRMLDVVWRIGIRFLRSLEQLFDMLETEQKRAVEERPVHHPKPSLAA